MMLNSPRRRIQDLPLFWKLLLPFLALMILVGAAGTVLVVRDLAGRAQTALDQELSRRSLDARTALHDRELYLLESVNFASNIQGMAEAIRGDDRTAVRSLLGSVRALKADLDVLVVVDADGRGVAEYVDGSRATHSGNWTQPLVKTALSEARGRRTSGIIQVRGSAVLAIAGPVCSRARDCGAVGVAIAGITLSDLASEALTRAAPDAVSTAGTGLTIFGQEGRTLAISGAAAKAPAVDLAGGNVRRSARVGSVHVETVYSPFEIGGKPAGSIAVTLPRSPAFASVRGAAFRLAFIVLGAMVVVVTLGMLLSRFILAQVRPLVATNRALGRGELSARVPVRSNDELGELAQGVNHMAEQLQASYETLESRVVERTEEVERLLQQRSDFFAAMSHEFRTPLAVILSEADMLSDPRKRPTVRAAREAGEALRASGAQLLSSINEILELAQADAGGVEVELGEVRLSDVVRELRPAVEGLAKGNGLRVTFDVSPELSPVVADPARLREVLLNLVDNSVKYTASGGHVAISAAQNNGFVEVSVSDSGVGIPPEIGERVFDPFYRVPGLKPLRGQASSGLGLALAKRFVEAQGGRIRYEARPEGGTIFTFTMNPS